MGRNFGGPGEQWFTHAAEFSRILARFKGVTNVHFLELGSWKGRSAIWLAENILTGAGSSITCVDTWDIERWDDSNQIKDPFLAAKEAYEGDRLYEIFTDNIVGLRHKIRPMRMRTREALEQLKGKGAAFDFIYIDADHEAGAVYNDFRGSLEILKPWGMIFLDDVNWHAPDGSLPVREAITRIHCELGIILWRADRNGAYYIGEACNAKASLGSLE